MQKEKIINILIKLEKLKKNRKDLWNISWEQGFLLSKFVKIKSPNNILEIGTSNGFSTLWLSLNLGNGKIDTIEAREKIIEEAKYNFKKANIINKINILKGEAIKTLKELQKNYDLIFIDANKTEYLEYLKIIENKRLMNKETIIIADNIISHKTTLPYKEYTEINYYNKIMNIGKGFSVSCKKAELLKEILKRIKI